MVSAPGDKTRWECRMSGVFEICFLEELINELKPMGPKYWKWHIVADNPCRIIVKYKNKMCRVTATDNGIEIESRLRFERNIVIYQSPDFISEIYNHVSD